MMFMEVPASFRPTTVVIRILGSLAEISAGLTGPHNGCALYRRAKLHLRPEDERFSLAIRHHDLGSFR
jgi:hypothetical protein